MIRIELPEQVDRMKDKRKKEIAWALKNLAYALCINNQNIVQMTCTKYKLKILDAAKSPKTI